MKREGDFAFVRDYYKKPNYLGGEVNRVGCEPIYETEAREARERIQRKKEVSRCPIAEKIDLYRQAGVDALIAMPLAAEQGIMGYVLDADAEEKEVLAHYEKTALQLKVGCGSRMWCRKYNRTSCDK